jgi:trimethylamine--corrinoid protein Co-methyltransferase
MPVQLVTAAQMGATAPVSGAGVLVQAMAEILGGLVYALCLDPKAKLFMGCWQLVSDLRTGAAATGSAEHALLGAAACQMARFYGIPNGVPSGITDSKMPDAQAGAEKALQHALIGNAGGNLLFSSAGTLASGMGISHAGLVIDNDVIGSALRTLSGIPVSEEEMAVAQISEVCLSGEGHYLGRQETLDRMNSDFHYPGVFDRSNIKDWVPSGAPSVLDHAVKRAADILANHQPTHIAADIDQKVRNKFNILIPADTMKVAVS